jgi:type VI protein secretion system component Hcp
MFRTVKVVRSYHGLNLPVDSANGKITGTRQHSSMRIEKEVDSSTPYLSTGLLKLACSIMMDRKSVITP